jgi:hypothetical protein
VYNQILGMENGHKEPFIYSVGEALPLEAIVFIVISL